VLQNNFKPVEIQAPDYSFSTMDIERSFDHDQMILQKVQNSIGEILNICEENFMEFECFMRPIPGEFKKVPQGHSEYSVLRFEPVDRVKKSCAPPRVFNRAPLYQQPLQLGENEELYISTLELKSLTLGNLKLQEYQGQVTQALQQLDAIQRYDKYYSWYNNATPATDWSWLASESKSDPIQLVRKIIMGNEYLEEFEPLLSSGASELFAAITPSLFPAVLRLFDEVNLFLAQVKVSDYHYHCQI
jgi:hypothetical protein